MRPSALAAAVLLSLAVPAAAEEALDLAALQRLRDEGFRNSRVMETLGYLADVIGPRLTGSPQMKQANEWTRDQLTAAGFRDARLEEWGPFGLGWSLEHVSVRLLRPSAAPLVAWPKAWTPGTAGPVRGLALLAPIEGEADFAEWKGKLAGRVVLVSKPAEFKELDRPLSQRYDDKQLAEEAAYDIGGGPREQRMARWRAMRKKLEAVRAFLEAEQPLAVVECSDRWPGVVRVQGGGSREKDKPRGVPSLVMAPEHYNRLARLLERRQEVELELDVRATFHDQDPMAYNTLAELPGGERRDEVVMLGAHLDSWHAGTGGNDNAAGSAVVLEAARLLASLGQRPRRTIRVALWSGEEQGLLGSRAWVARHLASRPEATDDEPYKGALEPKPEHARFAGYFNIDGGSGRVRGFHVQDNVAAAPVIEQWLRPVRDLGVTTTSVNSDGSTDHVPFDRAGVPAFNAIQDELDYETLTHHTNLDTYDHARREDLMQASVVMAWMAWQAANRPEPLPRKALPQPNRR